VQKKGSQRKKREADTCRYRRQLCLVPGEGSLVTKKRFVGGFWVSNEMRVLTCGV
jgi:hypothetical protein